MGNLSAYHLLFLTLIFGPFFLLAELGSYISSSSSEFNVLLISQNSFEPNLKFF